MIVDIALARDGFVKTKDQIFAPTESGVLGSLKPFFEFEQKDLQNFDGVSCNLINSFDPTNSIFIYKNDTGKFLYQIQSASPSIHKNNLIWNCSCVMLDTEENLTYNESNKIILDKNIFPRLESGSTPVYLNGFNVVVKDNFKTMQVLEHKFGIGRDLTSPLDEETGFCVLKIKYTTNPTTQLLSSKALDGSFNFLYPLTYTNGTIKDYASFGTSVLRLDKIVSKYLPNIKTIELLPFKCFENYITYLPLFFGIVENSGAVLTDAGVFIPDPTQFNLSVDWFNNILPNTHKTKQLLWGGGARGFVQTPSGNIQLDFNTCNPRITTENSFYIQIKEDGWKIDGIAKADIPPTYLNFYTDNAGQVFIQNITTNALELRNINRDAISDWQQAYINYYTKQSQQVLATGGEVASNLSGLNVFGAIGATAKGEIALQSNQIQMGYENQIRQEKYSLAKSKFEDKLQTESLLASLTGKQLAGQFNFSDARVIFNSKFFAIFIETNFKIENDIVYCQKDYDYSINTNGEYVLDIDGNSFSDAIRKMLGYDDIVNSNLPTRELNNYLDLSGLNYNIVFKIYSTITNKFSNTIILPIRNSFKIS